MATSNTAPPPRTKKRVRNKAVRRRLMQELKDIQEKDFDHISVIASVGNIREWFCSVNGPPDTPYDKGTWKLQIIVGQNWPHHTPKVILQTKILHVNVHKRVCLSVLDDWDSSYHLMQIPLDFYDLLREPDFEDPLNMELFALYRSNEQEYLDQVREHTMTYALHPGVTAKELERAMSSNNFDIIKAWIGDSVKE